MQEGAGVRCHETGPRPTTSLAVSCVSKDGAIRHRRHTQKGSPVRSNMNGGSRTTGRKKKRTERNKRRVHAIFPDKIGYSVHAGMSRKPRASGRV